MVNTALNGLAMSRFNPTQLYAGRIGALDTFQDSGALDYDDSIFNPMYGGGGYGGGYGVNPMYGGIGGGMYGWGPGSETMKMTQQEYLKYQNDMSRQMEEYDEAARLRQMDRSVRFRHSQEAAEFAADAPDNSISRQIATLQRKIKDDDQDNIIPEYGKLFGLVKKKLEDSGYHNVPEEQIKAYAEKLYANSTGANVVDDIKINSTSPFLQGIGEGTGIGFLFHNSKINASDNIATITGEKVSQSDKSWKWAGRILGALGTLIAIPLLIKGGKGLKGLIKPAEKAATAV